LALKLFSQGWKNLFALPM